MQDKVVWESSLIGTLCGLAAHYAALIPFLPGWLIQAVVTIAVGALSVVANHWVKRWLHQRWPNRRRKGDSQDTES